MIQYLQSWFPGWGGWYGDSQDPDMPEELLPSPSSWDILGEKVLGGLKLLLKDWIYLNYVIFYRDNILKLVD